MNNEDYNSELKEIRTKIGTLRVSRNVYAFTTTSFTLCTLSNVLFLDLNINRRPPVFGILMSLEVICTGIYGYQLHCKQKALNDLEQKEQELEVKKDKKLERTLTK